MTFIKKYDFYKNLIILDWKLNKWKVIIVKIILFNYDGDSNKRKSFIYLNNIALDKDKI